jgi:hypothetical protein
VLEVEDVTRVLDLAFRVVFESRKKFLKYLLRVSKGWLFCTSHFEKLG